MKVEIELNKLDDYAINYLSLGYLSLESSEVQLTNKDHIPNQSMMVFPTLADLMNGLHDLEMGDKKNFILHSTGASFELKFELIKGDKVRITESKNKLLVCDLKSLARLLWIEYKALFDRYQISSLDDFGDISLDLRKEVLNFEIAFSYALKGV